MPAVGQRIAGRHPQLATRNERKAAAQRGPAAGAVRWTKAVAARGHCGLCCRDPRSPAAMPRSILVLFAHPAQHRSEAHPLLARVAGGVAGRDLRRPLREYPRFESTSTASRRCCWRTTSRASSTRSTGTRRPALAQGVAGPRARARLGLRHGRHGARAASSSSTRSPPAARSTPTAATATTASRCASCSRRSSRPRTCAA